jgi:tRNA-specific 2-thiouridylase
MDISQLLESGIRFDGVPDGGRVVVAMSGGVDSSVCAALCQRAGYDVIGVTLQLYDHGEAVRRKGACCAGIDIHDARRVAEGLGIAHYVLDYETRFRDAVIDEFVDSYLAGATPIPCIRCNERVKFTDLLATARDLGGSAMVTGHYVRRLVSDAGVEMHTGADPRKDQSYFLFSTTRDQLEYLRFPLGGMDGKDDTRALAQAWDLPVAAKPDSQDICFVPEGRYVDVIERLRPDAGEPGDIVHADGSIVGRHDGIIHFTVGQRRGLGVGGSEPLYVLSLDADNRRVIVGPRELLARTRIELRETNWLGPELREGEAMDAMVRIRSTRPPVAGRVSRGRLDRLEVELAEPEYGVSPGQACVVYRGSQVLGGGWIDCAVDEHSEVAPARLQAVL